MENKLNILIKDRLRKRLKKISFDLGKSGVNYFYIGGNSLNEDRPNDYDIYPVSSEDFQDIKSDTNILLSKTKNCSTYRIKEEIVQLCNYKKDSLKSLVDSFDFAHIQVGAKVTISDKNYSNFEIDEVYFTQEYIESRVLKSSFYTGSEFPLSSLMRMFKYYQRNDIKRGFHLIQVIKILEDIVARGYDDYDDFKNQLEAIDLGFSDFDGAYNLFKTFEHRGLINKIEE